VKENQGLEYGSCIIPLILYGDWDFGKPFEESIIEQASPKKRSIHGNGSDNGDMTKCKTGKAKKDTKKEEAEGQADERSMKKTDDLGDGLAVNAFATEKKTVVPGNKSAKSSSPRKTFELNSDSESKSSTSNPNPSQDDVSEIYSLYMLQPANKPSRIPRFIGNMPRPRLPRLYLIDDEEPEILQQICTHDDTITEVFDMYRGTSQDPKIPDVKENVEQLLPLPLSPSASSASDSGSSSFYITRSLRSWVDGTSERKRCSKVAFDPYRYYFCFSLHKRILKGEGKDCDCLGCRQDFNKKITMYSGLWAFIVWRDGVHWTAILCAEIEF